MSDILDLIFVAVFVFWFAYGYRKGLVKILFHFVNLVLTWGISYLFHGKVADFLLKTPIAGKIYDLVSSWVSSNVPGILESFVPPQLNVYGFGSNISQNIMGGMGDNGIAYSVTSAVISTIAFVITFFSVSIILKVAERFTMVFFSVPGLNLFNRWGGIAVGAVVACIWGYIISICITVYGVFNTSVSGMIQSSFFMNNVFVNPLFFLDYF